MNFQALFVNYLKLCKTSDRKLGMLKQYMYIFPSIQPDVARIHHAKISTPQILQPSSGLEWVNIHTFAVVKGPLCVPQNI